MMKKEKVVSTSGNLPESGEEKLAMLIKEAGESARARKKKAMDEHFKRRHMAVTGALSSSQNDS